MSSSINRTISPMFYVASKALAEAMKGERVSAPKGSVYGVFATLARAQEFQTSRKLGLCSKIVEL